MFALLTHIPLLVLLTIGCQDGTNWKLAFNIHAADGHNFGYAADAWDDDSNVGTDTKAFLADYKSYNVTMEIANFVAIVRHQDGECEAVRVWEFLEPGSTLNDYLDTVKTSSFLATYDNHTYSYISPTMAAKDKDPIFAVEGGLTFNWWYNNNNGVRIANSGKYDLDGLPGEEPSDDSSYVGLGNELCAKEKHGGSYQCWFDVGVYRDSCDSSSCLIQGTDHGTHPYLKDGTLYGQYAIFISDSATAFPCEGEDLQTVISYDDERTPVKISKSDIELEGDFDRADRSNGFLEFDEYIFGLADHNKDGVLSVSEYSEARSENRFLETSTDASVLTDFNRIDKHGDLVLTIDEIVFDIADTNKDGKLSLEEYAEALADYSITETD